MSAAYPFSARPLIKAFEQCPVGSLELITPENITLRFEGNTTGPQAVVKIHDWALLSRIATRGDIGVGETYVEGLWDTPDLTAFIEYSLQNLPYLEKYAFAHPLARLGFYLYNTLHRRNNRRGSQSNIRAHYDVGNDFYRLWLDDSMTYSSALRQSANDDLATAQSQKYNRILNRLKETGQHILEIGCGWGGFAEMAAHAAHRVTGITLSTAQQSFASQRLQNKAEIKLLDYRAIREKFDAIVSIEMFEAVGERYWPAYFNKIKESLAAGGKALIQTITIADDTFEHYRRNSDYIRHYIFPGGMLPSKTRFVEEARKAGLAVKDMFAFGQDYAWTLEQWRQRFSSKLAEIRALGYSDKFIRSWQFYFSMCIGGFACGRTDVVQAELVHA